MLSTISTSNLKGYDQFVSTGAIQSSGAKLVGQAGFDALLFAGVPIVADEKCTSGYMFTLRKDTWDFRAVQPASQLGYNPIAMRSATIDGVMAEAPKTSGFAFTGFTMPISQFGLVGHLVLLGNLICKDPRKNGILTGISG